MSLKANSTTTHNSTYYPLDRVGNSGRPHGLAHLEAGVAITGVKLAEKT
jgi:hypothetical protein